MPITPKRVAPTPQSEILYSIAGPKVFAALPVLVAVRTNGEFNPVVSLVDLLIELPPSYL